MISPSLFLPARWPRYLLLGALFYFLFLIVSFPAYWLSPVISRISRGETTLLGTTGTIWSGSGELVTQPKRGAHTIGRFTWQLRPLALLTGRLQLSIQIQGSELSGRGELGVGVASIRIDSFQLGMPASLIGKFNAVVAFADPEGRLQLQTSGLEIGRGAVKGSAQFNWQDAGSRNFKLGQLGDYRLELKGQGGVADLQLTTARGDLQLTGTGQWRADNGGVLRFQGNAVAVGRQTELEPLLKLIGSQSTANQRVFSLNLPLPI
jgi:hypothetical protein